MIRMFMCTNCNANGEEPSAFWIAIDTSQPDYAVAICAECKGKIALALAPGSLKPVTAEDLKRSIDGSAVRH